MHNCGHVATAGPSRLKATRLSLGGNSVSLGFAMTVQKKELGRAGTAEMAIRPKTKAAAADELVGTVLDKHFPTPATSSAIPAGGRRPSRQLAPMDAATVTKRLSVGSKESSATHSASLGVPVAHHNSAKTKGVLPPTAPESRRPSGSRPCPVKRRASTGEVYGLDTRSLASLLRRRAGSSEDLATKDNESVCEDELPMTKAVSDMPRSEAIKILRPSTVDPDKIAQQKHMVEMILSDDLPGATSSMAVSATHSGHSGMSAEQEKSLARRRRSAELQALIIEGEVTEKTRMEVSEIQTVDVQDTDAVKSKEEKYWQDMWHMAKSARNDEKDVEEDGDDPFELEGVEIGLVCPD
eukprot:s2083_g8.t1